MTSENANVSAQQIFRDFVKLRLSPGLRELGLVGSSGRYMLPSETSWALLGLQGSKWNTPSEVQFTINLTVAGKAAWREARLHTPGLRERPSWNTSAYSGVSPHPATTRLAHLLPGGEYDDRWWTVNESVNLDALNGELVSAVRDYALPWFHGEIACVEQNDAASANNPGEERSLS